MSTSIDFILKTGVDLEARTIYVFGEITDELSEKVVIAVHFLDKIHEQPIKVILSSVGGSETAGYAIYDTLMATSNIVEMTGVGTVGSIAAAIYQAGDLRKMMPNCDYLIHDGQIGIGEITQTQLVSVADQVRKNNLKYYEILANGSKLRIDDIQDACHKETVYSAQECLEYGFCDEIVQTKIRLPSKKKRVKRKND